MKDIGMNAMIVQVPPSIVKLAGYVVAGQVFWQTNKQWEMAKFAS